MQSFTNFTWHCTTLQNFVKLYDVRKLYKALHSITQQQTFTKLHKLYMTLHNTAKLRKTLHCYETLRNFTKLYTTLHNFTQQQNFTKLHKLCMALHNTTKLWETWLGDETLHNSAKQQTFTKLYTTLHSNKSLQSFTDFTWHHTILRNNIWNFSKLYDFMKLYKTLRKLPDPVQTAPSGQ